MQNPETPPVRPPEQGPAVRLPVRPELVALLVEAAEAPPDWAELVTPQARLDGDLMLDECELAVLAGLLRARFGARGDLATLRAGCDLDGLEALTVADLERALPLGRVRT